MRRFLLYDNLGAPLGEIAEADVFEATLREVINGEHSLEITTTQVLDKGTRILYEDGRGYWREFVVCGVDGEHASGNRVIGTYYCVWSIQHDLQGVPVSVMPGVQNPVTAGTALHAILDATDRWSYGTVTNTNTGGASMYDTNAWDALSILVENWGGEIDVSIGVDFISGIVSRAVDLYAQQGSSTPTRRFDFGRDLQSVKRTYDDAPFYCRISPRGKGEQTDAGGYGRKITIESVNDGKDYLEYAPMVDVAKLPDGNGDYDYPTLQIENSDCETPADLLAWAQSVLAESCTPKITYTISAVQAAIAGGDVQGVSLGDAVEIVDRKFGADGLRLTGRVVELSIDMLNERNVTVVIGNAQKSVASQLSSMQSSIDTIASWPSVAIGANMSTADYIDSLLGRINAEINATGGYTYIVQGHGIVTYDTAVTDPTIGAEASQVVEIKGGSIRIANTKTSGGDWEWKTVFTSGHIAADLITALNVTAGTIQDDTGRSYWDLDNSIFLLTDVIANYWGYYDQFRVSQLTFTDNSGLLNNITTEQSATGMQIGRPESTYDDGYGNVAIIPNLQVPRPDTWQSRRASGSAILSRYSLRIMSDYDPYPRGTQTSLHYHSMLLMDETLLALLMRNQNDRKSRPGFVIKYDTSRPFGTHNYVGAIPDLTDQAFAIDTISTPAIDVYRSPDATDSMSGYGNEITINADSSIDGEIDVKCTKSSPLFPVTIGQSNKKVSVRIYGDFNVQGNYSATGSKSRLAQTENYGERLLYCVETPSPIFSDMGSGVIDSDGYCYVSIDDVFSETARTDISYQVFLQACGAGSLYVESKASTHFVVCGEPGLAFDWEIKAKQAEYENLRFEDESLFMEYRNATNYTDQWPDVYQEEYSYVVNLERLHADDIA